MAWEGRPRNEGRGLRGRALAWAYAKNQVTPPSVAEVVQSSTAGNPAPPTGNGRVKNGLRCEWWFDEPSGSIVFDRSLLTTPTDLVLSGGQRLQDSNYNNRYYLELSGGGSAVNLGPTELYDIGSNNADMTIEAWVRPTAANGLNPGPGRIISFSHKTAGATNPQNFMLGHGTYTGAGANAANYQARCRVGVAGDGQDIDDFSGDDTAKAELQHVVVTIKRDLSGVDGPGMYMDWYIDGSFVSGTYDSAFGVGGDWFSNYGLIVGNETGSSRQFSGGIYLIAIYERALSYGEVQQNYTEGVVSVTDSYTAGSQLFIVHPDQDNIELSGTLDITVQASGTRAAPVNITVDASSSTGTYGTHFDIVDKTKRIKANEYTTTFTVRNLNTSDVHVPFDFYIESATGSNVIQPVGANIDEHTLSAFGNVTPSCFYRGIGTPPAYTIPLGTSPSADAYSIGLENLYGSAIECDVSAGVGNAASANYALIDKDGAVIQLPGSATVLIPAVDTSLAYTLSSGDSGNGIWPDGQVVNFSLLQANVSGGSAGSIPVSTDASTYTLTVKNDGDAGDTVEPTSSTTGHTVHVDTTALTTWTPELADAEQNIFSNEGIKPGKHIQVPPAGLVLSGYLFNSEIKINTSYPIKFIDCFFSSTDQYEDANSYCINTHTTSQANQIPDAPGKNFELEYCSFFGTKSAQINTAFKRIYRCNFDSAIADYVKIGTIRNDPVTASSHEYLIEENYFGPRVNQKDSSLNGSSGMYPPDYFSNGGGPHCDALQNQVNDRIYKVILKGNAFYWFAYTWADQTVNPVHNDNTYWGNSSPDKIWQIGGNLTTPGGGQPTVDRIEWIGNWIYGGGSSFLTYGNTAPKGCDNTIWTALTQVWNSNKFAFDTKSIFNYNLHPDFEMTNITDGNNKFLRTGTRKVRLPQAAIDAGSLTSNGKEIVDIEEILKREDSLILNQTGLNKGGLTAFDRRSTPVAD